MLLPSQIMQQVEQRIKEGAHHHYVVHQNWTLDMGTTRIGKPFLYNFINEADKELSNILMSYMTYRHGANIKFLPDPELSQDGRYMMAVYSFAYVAAVEKLLQCGANPRKRIVYLQPIEPRLAGTPEKSSHRYCEPDDALSHYVWHVAYFPPYSEKMPFFEWLGPFRRAVLRLLVSYGITTRMFLHGEGKHFEESRFVTSDAIQARRLVAACVIQCAWRRYKTI